MAEHVVPVRIYAVIFATLLLLTLVTVDVAFFNFGLMNIYIALGIATTKATLVVLYFMHVRYSPRLTRIVVAASVIFLGIMMGLTLSDVLTRGWGASRPELRAARVP
jgi:cytochrome c oxidase subunit 4